MNKRAAVMAVITACMFFAGCAELQRAAAEGNPSPSRAQCYYEVFQADKGDLSDSEFADKLEKCADVIRSRLDAKGYTGANAFVYGNGSIKIELPEALADKGVVPDEVFASVTVQGFLEFKNADGETMLTGSDIDQAYPTIEKDQTGVSKNVVALRFSSEGAEKFGRLTEEAWDNNTDITITLDGNTISTAGVDNGPIYGGNAIIAGSFTIEETENLAMQIESGSLPLRLRSIDSGTGISEDPR